MKNSLKNIINILYTSEGYSSYKTYDNVRSYGSGFGKVSIFLLFLFLVGFNFEAKSAYCNSNIASTEAITPTSTSQNTTTYTNGRRAFTFNATAGSTYTFSTCGNTSVDTYLRLYSGEGGTLLVSNDDDCGLQSTISWTCTTAGAYSIFLTRYTCNTLNGSTSMSYSVSDPVVEPNIVQLGDPNSSTSDGRVPSYGYYEYSWSGLIYTAAEVGDPITINELQFDVKNSVSLTMTNQTIYMAHTTLDVFPNGNEPISGDVTTSDWTLVYSGDITWNQGWNPIALDNQFSYNGSGNLLIKTTNEHGSWTFNFPEFRYTAKTNSVVYNYADGAMPGSPGYRNEYRPNMKFGFIGGTALPIELLRFKGDCNLLEWETATENNNDYFLIESSIDGSNWEEFSIVGGAGTSLTTQTYNLKLNPTNRLKYYRLTQVDFDGASKVFKSIIVNCGENEVSRLNVYPNPNTGDFYVDFNSKILIGEGVITVTDVRGVEVNSQAVNIEKGGNVFHINMNAAPGIYYVQVSNGVQSSKMVKYGLE